MSRNNTHHELATNIHELGFSLAQAELIASNIIERKVILLALSGKLASGKDTLALGAMSNLGHDKAVHVYFGDSIKSEVNQIIALILDSNIVEQEMLIKKVEEEQGVNSVHTREIVELLLTEKFNNSLGTARDRSPAMRRVLQLWGTEVRREQDPLYWVNKTLKAALAWALEGSSVYLTDARFPNEVSPAQSVGFIVTRVEISNETQEKRLLSRDGIAVDLKAINHFSEIALDGYKGFDLIVDNNGHYQDTLETLTQEIGLLL